MSAVPGKIRRQGWRDFSSLYSNIAKEPALEMLDAIDQLEAERDEALARVVELQRYCDIHDKYINEGGPRVIDVRERERSGT